jgi:hypothetical protein
MSKDHFEPQEASLNSRKYWDPNASDSRQPTEKNPHTSERTEGGQVLGGLALLVLMIAGGWVGWLAFRNDKPKPMEVVTADASCERVSRILRDLTLTKYGIELATKEINEETTHVEGRVEAVKGDEREWARLEAAHKEFTKVREGLPSKLEAFTKQVMPKKSGAERESAGFSESDQGSKGTQVVADPGPDMLLAVEQFDAACRKLLELHRIEARKDGVTRSR